MNVTLSQMAILFVFIALGYAFGKLKLIPDDASKVLSKLELYLLLPAYTFDTMSKNLTVDRLSTEYPLIIASAVIVAVTFGLSLLLAKLFSDNPDTRAVYSYAFTIPNTGYIGYPLISAIFGETVLLDYMVFCIPLNLFIYTVGIYMLNPKHELKLSKLINPVIISVLLGGIAGLTGLTMPSVVDGVISNAKSCMGPIAMLLTGMVLAKSPLKEMLGNPKMYIAGQIRLIWIPLIAGAIMYLIKLDGYIATLSCCMLCLPMGLNNIVFPEAFGGDSKTGAQSCFVSNVLAILTVPVAFAIITTVFQFCD